jgi:protein-tyrosine phosphatase
MFPALETVKEDGSGFVMRRVLFLCYGNICRSPMAAGYLNKLVNDAGISDVLVESAGLGALVGNRASKAASEVAVRNGFSLESHRAVQITSADLRESDYILVMETYQLNTLRQHLGGEAGKVRLLGDYGMAADKEIEDPYGGDEDMYDLVFARIKECVEGFFAKEIVGS